MLRFISWIILLPSSLVALFYYAPGLKYRWLLSVAIELWPYLCIVPIVAFLLALILPKWSKRRIQIGLSALFLSVSLYPVTSWVGLPNLGNLTGITVMSYNLWIDNSDYDAIEQTIRDSNPDILFLSEISQFTMAELVSRLDYPNYYRADGGNNALLSRYPILNATTEDFGVSTEGRTFSLVANLQVNDEPVTVIGVHPPVPIFRKFFHIRNQQLDSFARTSREIDGKLILLGDFNATPWSPYFQRFERLSQLDNAGRGQGIWATWYFNQTPKTRPIKIPIDHIETRGFTALKTWAGSTGGSDHKPVITVLRPD